MGQRRMNKVAGPSRRLANDDGSSVSGYSHVARAVNVGDHVAEGDIIGWTDMSGRSTDPHLHFTFREGGLEEDTVDPTGHLQGANPYPRHYRDNQCGP